MCGAVAGRGDDEGWEGGKVMAWQFYLCYGRLSQCLMAIFSAGNASGNASRLLQDL